MSKPVWRKLTELATNRSYDIISYHITSCVCISIYLYAYIYMYIHTYVIIFACVFRTDWNCVSTVDSSPPRAMAAWPLQVLTLLANHQPKMAAKRRMCQENVVVTELCRLPLQCEGGSTTIWDCKEHSVKALSERKDRRPWRPWRNSFFINSQLSSRRRKPRKACYFKPHAAGPMRSRRRTDLWNMSLCTQGHSDGALCLLVIDIWLDVAQAESLDWYSL